MRFYTYITKWRGVNLGGRPWVPAPATDILTITRAFQSIIGHLEAGESVGSFIVTPTQTLRDRLAHQEAYQGDGIINFDNGRFSFTIDVADYVNTDGSIGKSA